MAMAVPAGIGLAGMIGSHFANRSASNAAMKQTPVELASQQGQQSAAGRQTQLGDLLGGQSQQLFNTGMPQLQQAGGYYSTLLNGNRAQMTQATAPERAQISDVYGGAARGVERSGLRGAQRDQAESEIGREKAGKIAGLIGGVRPGAAQALAGIGATSLSEASGAASGAGNAYNGAGGLYSGLIGGEAARRTAGYQAGDQASSQVGALTAQLLKAYGSKKGQKGGGGS